MPSNSVVPDRNTLIIINHTRRNITFYEVEIGYSRGDRHLSISRINYPIYRELIELNLQIVHIFTYRHHLIVI